MGETVSHCPKCADAFDTPLPVTAACPTCGVYFFKLRAPQPETTTVTAAPAPSLHAQGRSGHGRLLILLALIGVVLYLSNRPQVFAPGIAPGTEEIPTVAHGAAPAAPEKRTPETMIVERASEGPLADPELLALYQTQELTFDMQEEVYRIANLNGIRLSNIQFQAQEVEVQVGDGSRFAASAYAQSGFDKGQRVCEVRVIRTAADDGFRPGQKTTALENLMRRTTIAHELAHCLDWYNARRGWVQFGPQLPAARDPLSPMDRHRRWREELADVHAIVILRQALGEDLARQAMRLRALETRLAGPLWYRHAAVVLSSGEPLRSGSLEESERLVAKYWGS